MKKWIVKALVQGVLSHLPGGQLWNSMAQRLFTNSLVLTAHRFERKLMQCRIHLEGARTATGKPGDSFTVLELGTGWHPIIPIGMYLCGASTVWTIDIIPLLNLKRIRQVMTFFVEYGRDGRITELLPDICRERLVQLKNYLQLFSKGATAKRILEMMNINALVGDLRKADLADDSIEFFFSSCVLEHIPRTELVGIFKKFRKLARPDAVMNHLVDMSDHYADFDHSINVYNFLKYSERTWAWFNNPLNYQNRLRLSDYHAIHEEAGFKILEERTIAGCEVEFDEIHLDKIFQHYSRDDLLVTQARFIAVPDKRKSDVLASSPSA